MVTILMLMDRAVMNDLQPNEGDSQAGLCALGDIPDGGVHGVTVDLTSGTVSLVLTRFGNTVRAFHNECPHAGRRMDWAPNRFLLEHGHLVCAAHGAVFTLDTGLCVGGPCRGQTLYPFPVRVVDGMVRLSRNINEEA